MPLPVPSLTWSSKEQRVPLLTKVIYGTGDWGISSFNTIRSILYLWFLTNIVRLDPRLASVAAFVGILWDAVNDPIVGAISDRIRTRWGRRRPFLLIFAVPFGAAFLLLWWAPPWQTPLALTAHVTLAYMVADTLQTLISIPFYSLTPEMTEDYDERTSLSTYRMLFNLAASLVAAAGAPEIVRLAPSPQQGYLLMAGLFGLMGALPFIGIFFAARERKEHSEQRAPLVTESLQAAWNNVPFRIATTINLLNWVALDLVQLMLPYFIFVWVEQGNMNATVQLPIGNVGIASVTLFILIATAIVTLPLWAYLAGAWNKRSAYIAGMLFWAVVQTLLITIQPGQHTYIYVLSFLGGIGVSTAHVLPDALFPDVLEWDELRTGTRREGTYYGIRTLIRKVTGAVAIFLAGQTLGLFHYQTPPEGATFFQQAPEAQLAIRILTGPAAAVLLAGAIIAAFFYPLSREHHNRIRNLLVKRRQMRRLRAATSQSRTAP